MKITKEQHKALDLLDREGKIVRYDGGFWSFPGVELKSGYGGLVCPVEHVGTNTIKALIKKEIIKPSRMGKSKHGEYPIECVRAKPNYKKIDGYYGKISDDLPMAR